MKRNFFDEFDWMADKACDAIKAKARSFVAQGAITEVDEIDDLVEVKAALCAALRQEVDQWRHPLHSGPSDIEKNLMHF